MRTSRTRLLTALLSVTALAGAGLAQAAPATATPVRAGRYIVRTTSSSATTDRVSQLRASGATVKTRYSRVLNGFAGDFTAQQLRKLRADPTVVSVTPDARIHIADTQVSTQGAAARTETGAPWGLDRIDQRATAGDKAYHYDTTGKGVTAFVIDSGVRLTHAEFGGRAVSGYDFVDGDSNANDCTVGPSGHGTHVAGTIGGKTYGVAKQVSIVSLRIFDCSGNGYNSDFIAALDWAVTHQPAGGSVINFSGGGEIDPDGDAAVNRTIEAGIPVVVAAGNETVPACTTSPSRVPAALTVAASDIGDNQAYFTNNGSCVDLFAPGVNILSAGVASNTATATMSGTSMATPHVAGAVARYLQSRPDATPAQVSTAVLGAATRGAVKVTVPTPNLLLYSSTVALSYAPTVRSTTRSAAPAAP
jgi:subtilisin family serine protease